jgi:hypothetical protein
METLRLELDNTHSVGLGDNLCLLSALVAIPPTVELVVSNEHNTYDKLCSYKRIFRISDKVKISLSQDNGTANFGGYWNSKFFTEYHRPISVNTHGNLTKLDNSQDKKCIAIVTSSDMSGPANEWPWCRSRPLSYWSRIFEYVKKQGYEVITMDNAFFDLETKIEFLAKHCKAIISYEGGMAHVAHMLNIPCFIVDWKHPSVSTVLGGFHSEFVHRTNSVYILRDDEELFSWTPKNFEHQIESLKQGKTNNRLVTGDCKVTFAGPGVSGRLKVTDTMGNLLLTAPPLFGNDATAQLLSKYYS